MYKKWKGQPGAIKLQLWLGQFQPLLQGFSYKQISDYNIIDTWHSISNFTKNLNAINYIKWMKHVKAQVN